MDWQAQVRNAGSSNLVTDATVCFMPAEELAAQAQQFPFPFEGLPATHAPDSNGIYRFINRPDVFVPGVWILVVHRSNASPVIQPVELSFEGGRQVTRARGGVEAATVEISVGQDSLSLIGLDLVTTFKVTLHRKSEVVFLTGTEYRNFGTPQRVYAESRRFELYNAKRTDDGTLVTLFCLDDRRRETFVKAKPRKDPLAWLRINQALKPSTLPGGLEPVPGKEWPLDFSAPGENLDRSFAISIVELYEYLSEVGQRRPGTVREVSIFAHAWRHGPILYNSNERFNFQNAPNRDPLDFDGRVKDFNAIQMRGYPRLANAMAPNSAWHIWGCQAWPRFIRIAADAVVRTGVGDDQYYTLTVGNFQERLSKRELRRLTARSFREITYPAALTAALAGVSGVKVFAGAPGTWSNMTGPQAGLPDNIGRRYVVDKRQEFQVARKYLQSEPTFASRLQFSSGIDGSGYVDYARFRDVPIPSARPRTDRFALDNQEDLYFYDGSYQAFSLFDPANPDKPLKAQLTRTAVSVDVAANRVGPAGGPGVPGERYLLRNASGSLEVAVVVTIDTPPARVLVRTIGRDSAGNLTLLGPVEPKPFEVP